MTIDCYALGPFATNTYVLADGTDCWIVDPALGSGKLAGLLRRGGLAPSRILLTHGHGDHIAGIADIKGAFPGARLVCPRGDAAMLADPVANMSALLGVKLRVPPADELVVPGDSLTLGETVWQVLDTSGHTPGGVSYYCLSEAVVITGDSLFDCNIGRTDFPGGSTGRLIDNIRRSLLTLDDSTRVLPGHGDETTIGRQRRDNPYLMKS